MVVVEKKIDRLQIPFLKSIMDKKVILLIPVVSLCLLLGYAWAQEKDEETYSISLVQTAEVGKNIVKVDDRKVMIEDYTIKKGDHLWQIFRERGLLKKRNLGDIISILKKLNKSLTDLDLIHPGETIVIPLSIAPRQAPVKVAQKVTRTKIAVENLKDLDLENYTVQKGDSLVKIIQGRFDIPEEKLHSEYLQLVKKMNPSIEDLNVIHPGQVVRLPVYTPQIVRAPIERRPPPQAAPKAPDAQGIELARELGEIFARMGLDWVQIGQHFIPLQSGGQVDLKADSFPIINLAGGDRLIVDLFDELPEKMANLITSTWASYRVVHLKRGDDLRSALDKILPECQYPKIYKLGDPLELAGDIEIRLTADWIIEMAPGSKNENTKFMMVTLTDSLNPGTPKEIKDFLMTLGIDVIDYPLSDQDQGASIPKMEVLQTDGTMPTLIETALNLSNIRFSRNVEIPVYKSRKTDFNLLVKADFLLNIDGKDCIIGISGLGKDIQALLKEHNFRVLSLAEVRDPAIAFSMILDLIGVKSDTEPHPFLATSRVDSRNINIIIPGITFQDSDGQAILATHLGLPDDLVRFLNRKGYQILTLILS